MTKCKNCFNKIVESEASITGWTHKLTVEVNRKNPYGYIYSVGCPSPGNAEPKFLPVVGKDVL